MNPLFPIVELVDRYTIALLKHHKTQVNQEELDFYQDQLSNYNLDGIEIDLQTLYQIHSQIWALESDLKSGKENQVPLEEIGRRAIEIRNWNQQRITLKNIMAEKLNCKVREIKQDHLSQ
jgi:hypothetical protein